MPSVNKENKEANRHDSAWVEMNQVERRPRFQVNRVDGANGDDDEKNRLCDDDDDHIGSYAKSFRHFTREALPRLDHYRNLTSMMSGGRPTLDELHNEFMHGKNFPVARIDGTEDNEHGEGIVKFGWIKGVLVRNLLNIWGVMLFLRLSWVVGQAGIWQGVLLISSTSLVTILTALSMSAISTNGVIKGGGTYFMISRSLGPEFGASIGLIFALANAVACAMYTVGFCESLLDLLATFDLTIIDGTVQDTRIIGSITILCLLGIVVIGMEWEAKTQVGLLCILLVAITDFFIGALMGPQSDETRSKGFLGFSKECLVENFGPDYRLSQGVNHDFFSVFAVFFPAASGFLAGANISGDLRDPQVAIPKGTILSVVVTTFSYVLMAIVAGATVVRDASGNVEEYLNGTFSNCTNRECDFGLQNSFQVMELVSAFGPLIYAGCFAATLSSALASLVSAPKVFQALCKDNLYPYIGFFGKGYGKNGEPVRGYILTFFIALAFILVGELNAIAPLISNFFLAAYALINFSTFHSSLARPVGWRPSFRYYNMWLSLVGSILCVGVMFLISWWTALITLSAVLALYLIVAYRAPDVNWGSSTQAQTYKNALVAVQSLNHVGDHVKNYRPQILVLTGMPHHRTPLVDFAYLITKNVSLLMCGNIVKCQLPQDRRNSMYYKAQSWLLENKIKAFYAHIEDTNFECGAHSLMQVAGLGKLKPNILMLGYKADWKTCDPAELSMYFNVLHKALDVYMAVAILRLQEGLNYSDMFEKDDCENIDANGPTTNLMRESSRDSLTRNVSFNQMSRVSSISELSPPSTPQVRSARINENPDPDGTDETPTKNSTQMEKEKCSSDFNRANQLKSQNENRNTNETDETPVAKSTPKVEKDGCSSGVPSRNASSSQLSEVELNNLLRFQMKQKKGVIDVWWLYDDGGLTLLLPYIINTRRSWSQCKLRVFTLANKKDDLLYEQRSMASLLSKFRIDYSDLKVIPDITKKPQEETVQFFDSIIKDLKISDDGEADGVHMSKAEMTAMKDKTNRHLRLRELLLEHSMNANLIVMTLPMPRKNMTTACLYLAWLEMLTKDMPPFLLVRGNQQSVLTFNS